MNPDSPVTESGLRLNLNQWQTELRACVTKIVSEAIPNWDSYGAETPTVQAQQRLVEVLESLGQDACESVSIVPTRNGGFEASWDTSERGFEIHIPAERTESIEYVTVEKVRNPETKRTDPFLSTYEGGVIDAEEEIAKWYHWVTRRPDPNPEVPTGDEQALLNEAYDDLCKGDILSDDELDRFLDES